VCFARHFDGGVAAAYTIRSPFDPGSYSMTKSTPTSAPAYQQLKDYILQKIESEEWRAGDMIPSEPKLAAEFGVARMTVNRAMRELVTQRVLMRIRGAGTFVTDTRYQSTLIEILNIAEEIKSRGHQHTSEVLLLERTSAPEALEALQLPPDGHAFHSRIVHFENKVPIQFEDRHASGVLFPDYINQDFRALTPNDYMTSLAPAQGVE
jgi:GntR family histidine utilization transcriptional repressor